MSVSAPRHGARVYLDFCDIKHLETTNSEQVEAALQRSLDSVGLRVLRKLSNAESAEPDAEPKELAYRVAYVLVNASHLHYTSLSAGNAVIDAFVRDELQSRKLEVALQQEFHWEKCTTNNVTQVTDIAKLTLIDQMPDFASILHRTELKHREQTQFQELRIYDTKQMGRVLVLDDFINIYDKEMEDQYTLDLPRHVTMRAEKQELENVLIIGGGDCLVANHMLRRFPNIKKVTMCEIDRRVVENVQHWFEKFDAWVLKENLATGRYNLIYQDGSKFVETAPSEHYDGVIIDCTDTWTENSPSYVLTTVPFYKHIYRILKKGGSFSQMCSQPTFDGWFKDRWLQAGFNRAEFDKCFTVQYGGYTPFGFGYKD